MMTMRCLAHGHRSASIANARVLAEEQLASYFSRPLLSVMEQASDGAARMLAWAGPLLGRGALCGHQPLRWAGLKYQ